MSTLATVVASGIGAVLTAVAVVMGMARGAAQVDHLIHAATTARRPRTCPASASTSEGTFNERDFAPARRPLPRPPRHRHLAQGRHRRRRTHRRSRDRAHHPPGANLPIPYDAIASLREADGDPVRDQTTDRAVERLNEIRDQLMQAAAELPGAVDVRGVDAAAGVFAIDFADGTG